MKRMMTVLALGAALAITPALEAQTSKPASKPADMEKAMEKMGTMFFVDDPVGRNTVTFTSEAPLEDIVGTTNKVAGHVIWDPENPAKAGMGMFTVPVASLDTGIPMRDEHLQGDRWLNAAEHPTINLMIKGIENVELEKETEAFKTYSLDLNAELELHGQKKDMTIPGKITYMPESEETKKRLPGNLMAARAEFTVALSDFGVSSDSVGLKVAEEIEVDVRFVATDVKPEAEGEH